MILSTSAIPSNHPSPHCSHILYFDNPANGTRLHLTCSHLISSHFTRSQSTHSHFTRSHFTRLHFTGSLFTSSHFTHSYFTYSCFTHSHSTYARFTRTCVLPVCVIYLLARVTARAFYPFVGSTRSRAPRSKLKRWLQKIPKL